MKFYILITAGRGPVECAVVVEKIHQMILDGISKSKICNLRVLDYNEHDSGRGCMSITSEVVCPDRNNFLALKEEWEGTIKWVCTKNTIRPNHKRKNWFVGVSFYEVPDPIEIRDIDIRFQSMRSSGPGGQNVNKVESAVRATHIPTGISVVVQTSRDQSMNRKIAYQHLIDRLSLIEKYKRDVLNAEIWSEHDTLQRGGQIKTFKGEL